jgi:starch phosphorylase
MDKRSIAYFSMEIALDAGLPTYSGGLGVLAGDTIRSAADLGVPMVAVTLLYRKGYFFQHLDQKGTQTEEPVEWIIKDFLEEMPDRAKGILRAEPIQVRAWKYEVVGAGGCTVPVYFLDTDLEENPGWVQKLTDSLYSGDQSYRLCQEAILGIIGVRMLRILGYNEIERYHMNEGHASLLTLELLAEEAEKAGRSSATREDIERVKERCIFTTHTPVPAGHDKFPLSLVSEYLGHRQDFFNMTDLFCTEMVDRILGLPAATDPGKISEDKTIMLNMTYLALNLSHYVNGVAKKHGEVSQLMFAGYHINAITNGIHAASWASEPVKALFDKYISGWRQDNFSLRSALSIPKEEFWQAHTVVKKDLMYLVNRLTNEGMDSDMLTLGFARRATAYKRAELLFTDMERLKSIAKKAGPFQVIYGGKAHPNDEGGKEIIKRIFACKEALKDYVKVVYLENYDLALAKILTSGVDLWLNTPQPPMEASGTSGMKAAVNGVPSLSILDGWWIEGHIEGITGWSIGDGADENDDPLKDAASLYNTLENVVIPLYYGNRDAYTNIMRHCIALNGSFFNTHRMLQQYVLNAYFL